MNQKEAILNYLIYGGTITQLGALNLFGCFRLGARIYELKIEGWSIKSRIIKCDKKHYAEYYIGD
jgi:hypothetical protein